MKLLVSLAACMALAAPLAAQNNSSPPQDVQRKAAALAQVNTQQRAQQAQVERASATKAWQRRQAGKKAMAAAAARDAKANNPVNVRNGNAEAGNNAGQQSSRVANTERGYAQPVSQVSQARNVPVQVRLASAVRQAAQSNDTQLDGSKRQQIKNALKQRFVSQQRREQRVNFQSKAKRQGLQLVSGDNNAKSSSRNNAQNRRRFATWSSNQSLGRSSNPSRQRVSATRSSASRQPVQKVSSVRRRAVSASTSRRSPQGAVRTSKPVGQRNAVKVSKAEPLVGSKVRSSSKRR